ncbi:hypothetical protein [Rothia sp. HSID18067]|uniref:hypothetical protein n=1 Tax=Rothia sp. HSID18067 TaxID=2419514 RepID=UPI000F861CE9|nr:hypothetical protein [Rothia sp. HSID18067]
MSRRKDHAHSLEHVEHPKTPARTSSSSVSAEASAPVPELVLYPTNPSSISNVPIGPQLPQRYEPALTPSLISAILAQGIVAFPVVWLFLGTLNQPPQPLVFYVLLVLLPPAGITWCAFLFLKLRQTPAFWLYYASFLLVPHLVLFLSGLNHGLYVVAATSIGAGYYSGNVLLGYYHAWRVYRMSNAEYARHLVWLRSERQREQQNAVGGGALALVLLILLGLAVAVLLSGIFPIYILGKSYDPVSVILPSLSVVGASVALSVFVKRVIQARVIVVVSCVVVVVVGVVLVVGFPGCMVVVPGVLGFGLGDVLVSSLGVYARELQGSVRRKTQRRSPR